MYIVLVRHFMMRSLSPMTRGEQSYDPSSHTTVLMKGREILVYIFSQSPEEVRPNSDHAMSLHP
jgi:hypothetical protein